MKITDFYDRVEEQFEGVGIMEDRVLIKSGNIVYGINIDYILETDWKTIESILLGVLDPEPIVHISRIVGYFSRIGNWNISKLGELKDRHRGNYKISEG